MGPLKRRGKGKFPENEDNPGREVLGAAFPKLFLMFAAACYH